MSDAVSGPDVQQLDRTALARSEFPGGRQQSFRVFFAPAAYREIWSHAQADTSVEICGVLVGRWEQDDQGPFVIINASIRGQQAETKFAEVTFTHETWSAINAEMDTRYADQKIVGWYHTHPDFGIFLSDRDRFIHENFFSGAGQIALVVDPIRRIEGVFVWRGGKPAIAPHYWVGDDLKAAAAESTDQPTSERVAASSATAGQAPAGAGRPGGWLRIAESSIQFLLVFIVGYLLAGRLNDATLVRAQRVGLAYAVYQLGLRPGLEIRIGEMQKEAGFLIERCRELEDENFAALKQQGVSTEKLAKAQENQQVLSEHLDRLTMLLATTENEFCLNRDERELLEQMIATRSAALASGRAKSDAPQSKAPQPKATQPDAPKSGADSKPSQPAKPSGSSRPADASQTPPKS